MYFGHNGSRVVSIPILAESQQIMYNAQHPQHQQHQQQHQQHQKYYTQPTVVNKLDNYKYPLPPNITASAAATSSQPKNTDTISDAADNEHLLIDHSVLEPSARYALFVLPSHDPNSAQVIEMIDWDPRRNYAFSKNGQFQLINPFRVSVLPTLWMKESLPILYDQKTGAIFKGKQQCLNQIMRITSSGIGINYFNYFDNNDYTAMLPYNNSKEEEDVRHYSYRSKHSNLNHFHQRQYNNNISNNSSSSSISSYDNNRTTSIPFRQQITTDTETSYSLFYNNNAHTEDHPESVVILPEDPREKAIREYYSSNQSQTRNNQNNHAASQQQQKIRNNDKSFISNNQNKQYNQRPQPHQQQQNQRQNNHKEVEEIRTIEINKSAKKNNIITTVYKDDEILQNNNHNNDADAAATDTALITPRYNNNSRNDMISVASLTTRPRETQQPQGNIFDALIQQLEDQASAAEAASKMEKEFNSSSSSSILYDNNDNINNNSDLIYELKDNIYKNDPDVKSNTTKHHQQNRRGDSTTNYRKNIGNKRKTKLNDEQQQKRKKELEQFAINTILSQSLSKGYNDAIHVANQNNDVKNIKTPSTLLFDLVTPPPQQQQQQHITQNHNSENDVVVNGAAESLHYEYPQMQQQSSPIYEYPQMLQQQQASPRYEYTSTPNTLSLNKTHSNYNHSLDVFSANDMYSSSLRTPNSTKHSNTSKKHGRLNRRFVSDACSGVTGESCSISSSNGKMSAA